MWVQILYRRYQSFRPFTDDEAWLLFKLAAIGEAVGWSLLIGGILTQHFLWPTSNIPVLLAGRIHGTLFLIYIIAAIVLAPSLGWSLPRTILAGLCSVPPYGTLAYEQLIAQARSAVAFRELSGVVGYKMLALHGVIQI
jgi:integral membrane protein